MSNFDVHVEYVKYEFDIPSITYTVLRSKLLYIIKPYLVKCFVEVFSVNIMKAMIKAAVIATQQWPCWELDSGQGHNMLKLTTMGLSNSCICRSLPIVEKFNSYKFLVPSIPLWTDGLYLNCSFEKVCQNMYVV